MNTFSILAADIGATFSRFARFSVHIKKGGLPRLDLKREFHSHTQGAGSFEELLEQLKSLPDHAAVLEPGMDFAAIAPPGPVAGGICRPPNIPWDIDPGSVTRILGIPRVFLLNDFVAQGYGCLYNRKSESNILAERPLREGHPTPGAPLAVVGAGTGLGKALILEDELRVLPSEGGHASFPFAGEDEFAFARYLARALGQEEIEADDLLSGRGFACIFAFHSGRELTPPDAVQHALDQHASDSQKLAAGRSLEWFARFYGRVCRDFVLDSLALGGLVLTGGMASRIPVLEHPAFLESFEKSTTQANLLRALPIHHMQSPQAGLFGAAFYGALRAMA